MRGRVMALYSIVFLGSTPIGGPLSGWLSEAVDPRAALVMAGIAAIVGAVLARIAFDRVAQIPLDASPSPA
jgi:MFS family permease